LLANKFKLKIFILKTNLFCIKDIILKIIIINNINYIVILKKKNLQ